MSLAGSDIEELSVKQGDVLFEEICSPRIELLMSVSGQLLGLLILRRHVSLGWDDEKIVG